MGANEFDWVCAELRQIAEQIRKARLYTERLRRAGEPVGDLEARLREQVARYQRMLEAFPECKGVDTQI